MSKKPRKPKASPAIHWTETDLSGDQFLALCERERRGELRLTQCGVGSSNGVWNVQYFGGVGEAKPSSYCRRTGHTRLAPALQVSNPAATANLPVDFSGAKPWR